MHKWKRQTERKTIKFLLVYYVGIVLSSVDVDYYHFEK